MKISTYYYHNNHHRARAHEVGGVSKLSPQSRALLAAVGGNYTCGVICPEVRDADVVNFLDQL